MGIHRMKQQEYIDKVNKIHNNFYDYSKIVYKGSHKKIEIICPIHGSFLQLATGHMSGYGCEQCGKINSASKMKYTNEEFIKKSEEIHGKKYDYSKVKYLTISSKVEIICPIHGSFWQIPHAHFKGHGCKKCSDEDKMYTSEEFFDIVKKVHGNVYDYSKSIYTKQKKKIIITCRQHGDFLQSPNKHMKGNGCPKCASNRITLKLTKSTEKFITESKKIHGKKYDYSKTVYTKNKKNVTIICKNHGDFSQRPSSHLDGNGCPKCSSSIGENIVRVFLEKNKIYYESQKTFPKCKYKNKLRYDFYIPEINLLIEVDGFQHFPESVGAFIMGFSGHSLTQEMYDLTKLKDKIKDKYASDNGIKLLRIPYKGRSDRQNIIPLLEKYMPTSQIAGHNWFG